VPGGPLPAGWAPLQFRNIARTTDYALVADAGGTVVRAVSEGAASGLVHAVDVAAGTPVSVAWRWKADGLIATSDARTKQGDDFAARVYFTFRFEPDRRSAFERMGFAVVQALYGMELPHATLAYVWDRTLPVGTVLPNAHTDRVRMIVVESGPQNVGRWRHYERDLMADFRRAFGEVGAVLTGAALMTDTDNTGGRVTAWYGDIELRTGTRP